MSLFRLDAGEQADGADHEIREPHRQRVGHDQAAADECADGGRVRIEE